MSCLFRGRIAIAGSSPSSVLRIHVRHPINSKISLLRGYATRNAQPAIKIPRPPPPPSTRSNVLREKPNKLPPPPTGSDNPQYNRIKNAERLFKAGTTKLYTSTKRTTVFRVNSWALFLAAGLGCYVLWDSGFLSIETFLTSGHKYPKLVAISETVACVFLGIVLGIAWIKARNHIHSIQLVQHSGKVQLQLTYRSFIPFVKRSFIVQPEYFTISDPFAAAVQLPQSLFPSAPNESAGPAVFTAGVIRETFKSISKSIFRVFEYFHNYFTGSGLYRIDIMGEKNKKKHYTMDAGANYLLNQKDIPALWDVVETKDPYDI